MAGGLSNPYASGSNWKAPQNGWRASQPGPHRGFARLLSAVSPWLIASAVATVLLGAELAPRADQTNLPEIEPAPAPSQEHSPGHSDGDDVYFDPAELVSV